MPTFRTQPSRNLGGSIRRLLATNGGRLSPLDEAKADSMAAQTAQHLSLAEKARAEAEQIRASQRTREDPAVRTEYAAHASGVDLPDATRLMGAIRGQLEQPGPSDIDDAAAVGREAQPYPMARPNLQPGQEGRFRGALAAAIGNQLATGHTNAEQLARAGSDFQTQDLTAQAANAETVPDANRLIAAARGKIREPFKTNAQGTVLNEETGDLNEGTQLAGAVRRLASARQDKATEGPLGKPPPGYRFTANGDLEKIPGGPADIGKPLPNSAVKDLGAAGTAVEDTQRLVGSFKDEFGGKTILGDFSNTYKRIAGDKTGQAQWWQDMDALQNQTRHALFGSALTATELKAWDKTSIQPRMNPEQIRQNLERRSEIEARAASKLARSYEIAGYNKDQIAELLGVGARYLKDAAPPANPVGQPDRRKTPGSWSIKRVQ